MVFPVVMHGCESWTIKKAEHWKIDAFELWCWRRLLRVPWTARKSNQSILKKSVLNILWKDWCWSWNSNILATWCEELTHRKRLCCWERLRAGGEGDDRGWDGWKASLTRCMWVWVNSRRWWRTGKPGVLHSSSIHLLNPVDSLWPYGLQHARLPHPSPTPGACSNSCPSSRWSHSTISSFVIPFSSCFQSFPASGSFPKCQFFTSGGQSIGASTSASVLPKNIQDWFSLGLTGLISWQSKGLSRVFSNTTIQKHQFFSAQPSFWSHSHIHTWLLEKP